MPNLDEVAVSEGRPSIYQTNEMFEAAHEYLSDFLNRTPILFLAYGSKGLVREGDKRQVHWLEVTDPNGITLRVEVFFK